MSNPTARSPRLHYGHLILGLAFLSQLFSTGLVFYAFGVFLGPVSEDLGWGKAETALGFSLFNVAAAVYNPILGRLIERWGARRFIIAGCILTAMGLLSLTFMSRLWHFYALMLLLVGLGGAAMGPLPLGSALVHWFIKGRSFAIGVASSGVSLGGVLVSFIGGWLILHYGWRTGMRALAISILVVLLYPMIRYMVDRPEQIGLGPDGSPTPVPVDPSGLPNPHDRKRSAREVIGDRDYWRFLAAYGVSIVSLTGVLVFLIKTLTDFGYSPWIATRTFGMTAMVGFAAKPLVGYMGDRLDKRWVIFTAVVSQIFAVALLLARPTPTLLLGFSLLFGLGMSANLPLFQAWIADHYGRGSYPTVVGLMSPPIVAMQASGHFLGGKMFDLWTRWDPTLAFYLILYFVTLGLLLRLPGDTRRESAEPLLEPIVET